jgi:multiple sugar transport system substrate-binding protein
MSFQRHRKRLISRTPFGFQYGWVILFGLLLMLKLLSACTPVPANLSLVVTQDEAGYWPPLIEEFETQHPNVKINFINGNESILDKPKNTDELKKFYASTFNKGSPYDLIYLDLIWLPEFAQAGWLMDLTSEFTEPDWEDAFLDSEIQAGYFKDKLYRIPFRTDVGVLFYRQDLLTAAGYNEPPATFDELLQLSQRLIQTGKVQYGYLWQGRQTEALAAMFVEVLQGYGGFWFNTETGEVGLAQPPAIRAMEFLRKTITEEISPPAIITQAEEQTRDLFRQGQAAFMRNWPSAWVEVSQGDFNVSGKIGIVPMVHAEGQKSGSCQGGWGFAIAQDTPHKQAALEAVKFFTSASAQRQLALTYGAVPSRKALFTDPQLVQRYRHYPDLLKIIENYSVSRPRTPEYDQASCILQKYLSQALKPDNSQPNMAMEAAAKETRQLLSGHSPICQRPE